MKSTDFQIKPQADVCMIFLCGWFVLRRSLMWRMSTDRCGLCTHVRISWLSALIFTWTYFSPEPSDLQGRKEFLWKEGEFSSLRYRHRQRYRHRSTIKRSVKTCQLSAYQPAYGGKGGAICRKRMKEKDRQKEHLLSIACLAVTTDFICWPRAKDVTVVCTVSRIC